MNETFSEDDLAPNSSERRSRRRLALERVVASIGISCSALIFGGMVALGATAAPAVFRLTPKPFSGTAMGAAFASFGQIALAAACVALLVELGRTVLTRHQPPQPWDRVRRLVSVGLAGCAAYMALNLTPQISALHESGAVRNEGEKGALLDQTHRRAELVGKVEVGLALGLIFLHVMTLRGREPEDEEVFAPRPPGPQG